MLEIEALVERWQPTSRTRLLMDADQVARDPRLALVGKDVSQRGGLRIFPRGGGAPATPEERFAERYRRAKGSVDVSPSRMQEAAFARVHMVDLILVGRALEAGSAQHSRLRDIPPGTRVQLMTRVLERMEEMSDDLLKVGTAEWRTRKGMEWEMERIRAFLSPDVLEDMAQAIVKRRWDDGTRMFMEGLGTVAVMVPSLGSLSRAMLSLGSSLMTGNFTFVSAPTAVPATTLMALRAADEVMREKGVQALAAVVPDDASHLTGIVSESPRVEGLVMFEEGEAALDAAAQATALGKAVVGAWETSEVAIVWDGVDVASAAEEIVRSRFTDSGSLPSSIGKVLVQEDAQDAMVSALEAEMNSLQVGLPSDPSTDIGPVRSLGALEHIQDVVREAIELGGRVIHGGERINWRSEADPVGMYFQPTLLVDCDTGMRISNERLVGPVLPVCSVKDAKEARAISCRPQRPGRVWIWATSRADRDRLVDGMRVPGIVFFGERPGGSARAMELADAWGTMALAERLSYKTWRGPVGQ